jgi:proteasome accessory factor A
VRDYVFHKRKLGLIDVHDRDYDEPAGNGGFLYNGGRLYLDMGHVEYCTAECLNLADVVGYDLAGEEILQAALQELGLAGSSDFVKNNIDHYTGATFGCHENYLMNRDAPLRQDNIESLLAFLTLRGLMTGAGRVGAVSAPRRYEKASPVSSIPYQIMQRADYIQTEIYEWVQFNRALINARDEPLADPTRFRRLHLLLGDSNVLPFTNALKIGSTAVILDLLELDKLPPVSLADPVRTMRELSHSPDGPWMVELAGGKTCESLDLLERFLEAAQTAKLTDDPDAQWTLQAWEQTLRGLRRDRSSLVGKIDWITKQELLQQFMVAEKINWNDPWLESLDLEFHKTDLQKNLFRSLPGTSLAEIQVPGTPVNRDLHFAPPANTRAAVRSQLMRQHANDPFYVIDWDFLQGGRTAYYSLDDPFSLKTPAARLIT